MHSVFIALKMKTIDPDLKQATSGKAKPPAVRPSFLDGAGWLGPLLPCLPLISDQRFAFHIPGSAGVGQEMEKPVVQLLKPSSTSTVRSKIH